MSRQIVAVIKPKWAPSKYWVYILNEQLSRRQQITKKIFLLVLWSILIYWDAPVHKYHRSSQTSSARIRYKTLYINFASNVNILNCVQAEIRCFRCAKSAHTRFVCTSIITEKCTTAVCHYNRLYLDYNRHSSKPCNTGFFIQPRAVVCVYTHAAVGCFELLFSLYFTQCNERRLELFYITWDMMIYKLCRLHFVWFLKHPFWWSLTLSL